MQAEGEDSATSNEELPAWAQSTPEAPVQLWNRQMTLLPGSVFQQVLMPLDYRPSRDLRPRWGNTRPPHPGLMALFRRDEHLARRMIIELRTMDRWFQQIPR